MTVSSKRRMMLGLGILFASAANMNKVAGHDEKTIRDSALLPEVEPQLWQEITDQRDGREIPGFLKRVNINEWGLRSQFRQQVGMK